MKFSLKVILGAVLVLVSMAGYAKHKPATIHFNNQSQCTFTLTDNSMSQVKRWEMPPSISPAAKVQAVVDYQSVNGYAYANYQVRCDGFDAPELFRLHARANMSLSDWSTAVFLEAEYAANTHFILDPADPELIKSNKLGDVFVTIHDRYRESEISSRIDQTDQGH